MKYVNFYVDVLKKFGDFKTRSGRQEFWVFFLISLIISFLLGLISQYASYIFSIITLVPWLALGARRLHDIGKSGWLQLLALIPIVGIIILIIWWATEGTSESNNWGDVPTGFDL